MRRKSLAAAVSVAALLTAAPALAQSAAAQQAERDELVKGLQAQYEVALIRERKMADDRETALIGVLEVRLKAARAQADAAKGDARQANAALASARAEYVKLAAQVAQHDPAIQADVTAYHTEAKQMAAKASPEKLAALQTFADGDRTQAWPALQALAGKEASSESQADRAADALELANLRNIMRGYGEATSADVLALYDEAAKLNPSDFRIQLARAVLLRDMGDLPAARTAAQQALAVSTDEYERARAIRTIGEEAAAQDDNVEAAKDYDQALALDRQILSTDKTALYQDAVANTLKDKADLEVRLGQFAQAQADYAESLALRQAVAEADPFNPQVQDYVTSIYQRIGDLDFKTGDLAGARTAWQQGLAIRQKLLAADPNNADLQYYTSALMRRIGDAALKQGDYAVARQQYEACLAIRQRLSAANPSSAQLKSAVALDYFDLGALAFEQRDLDSARTDYSKSLAIRRDLAAADPTDFVQQQLILQAMTRLAQLQGGVTWEQVRDQYKSIKDQGRLVPNDEKVLSALRTHGLADGL